MTDNERVALAEAAPTPYRSLLTLYRQVLDHCAAVDLPPALLELVKIRISALNGCAYCLRLHTRDAVANGESQERLAVLPAWRETGYFTDQERSALALAEAITRVGEGQVPDAVYHGAAAHLSDEQIAAVAWLAVAMNALNRVAITSRNAVDPAAD